MAKKKKKQQQQEFSPEQYIRTKARQLPIYKCYIGDNAGNSREKLAIVVRQHAGGTFTYACFLLDCWCIGVKDAFWDFSVSESELDRVISHYERGMNLREVSYVEVHNWIYGAVDWATNAGINPCKEFALAKYLLLPDDDEVELIEYDFGLDGEYVLEAKNQQEANKYIPALKRSLGEGNYRVIISPLFGKDDDFDYDDEDEDDYEDEEGTGFREPDFSMAGLNKALKGLKKMSEDWAELPNIDYTYKGGDYPQTLTLRHPEIQSIVEKYTADITDKEMKQVLSLPHADLRHDLHQMILWEIGVQWGKTSDDYQKEGDDSNWCIIGNSMMFLLEAGNEETVPVILETLRQSYDFLEYNIGDWMEVYVEPLLFTLCKDNPELLESFLLEEGLTAHAKNNVWGVLTDIGLLVPEQRQRIVVMTARILERYIENLPEYTICDGSCTAFGIDVLVSLGATEYLPLIEELYATKLVDEYVVGPIKSVRKEIRSPHNYERKLLRTPYEVRDDVRSFMKRQGN